MEKFISTKLILVAAKVDAMKFCIVMFVFFSGTNARADFLFQCSELEGKHAASVSLPDVGTLSPKSERVCNGGVGDPMICEDRVVIIERRVLSVWFSRPASSFTSFPIERTLRYGTDPDSVAHFRGDRATSTERGSKISFASDAETVELTLTAALTLVILNCYAITR